MIIDLLDIIAAISETITSSSGEPTQQIRKLNKVPVINGAVLFKMGIGVFLLFTAIIFILLMILLIINDLFLGIFFASLTGIIGLLLTLSSKEWLTINECKIARQNLFGAITEITWDEVTSIEKQNNGYVIHGRGKKRVKYLTNFNGYEQFKKIIRRNVRTAQMKKCGTHKPI